MWSMRAPTTAAAPVGVLTDRRKFDLKYTFRKNTLLILAEKIKLALQP